MPPGSSRDTIGLFLGGLGVVIFGGTLPFTRLSVEGLDPWFVSAGRAALSELLTGVTLLALRRKLPGPSAWPALPVVSLTLVGGFPGFTGLAMMTVDAVPPRSPPAVARR
jgi:drug/metabolite transporter (DMT)-like permease